MIYLFDTDTCIHLMRGTESVVARASRQAPDDIGISAITDFELRFGALRCAPERRNRELAKVERLLGAVHTLPFANETARHAALVRAQLEALGQPIGPMDTLIAGCGLEYKLTVVTGNTREFSRVPELACESWL